MKVIGKDEKGNYIAVISKTEVQKVCDKYYNKMPDLEVGQEFDLSGGYEFRNDIKAACDKMVSVMNQFDSAKKTMFEFAVMVNKLPAEVDASAEKVMP
jgi:hypothetical protein